MSYVMSNGQDYAFDENCQEGRQFIKAAIEVAAAASDEDDPLVYERTQLGDDGIAEAFFHDSAHIYFVRDEEGARLEYACAR